MKLKRVPVGQADEFTGLEILETDEGVQISQFQYIDKKLQTVELSQKRSRQQQAPITDDERSAARSCAGALRWVHRTVMEPGYELNRLSSWIGSENCTVAQLIRLNKVVNYIKRGRRPHNAPPEAAVQPSLFLPRLEIDTPIKVVMICDAGDPKDDGQYRGKWQGAVGIGICSDWEAMPNWQGEDVDAFGCVYWKMALTRRTCNSSYDGESNVFIEGLDVALSVQELAEEYECATIALGATHHAPSGGGARGDHSDRRPHGLERPGHGEPVARLREGHAEATEGRRCGHPTTAGAR